MANLKDIKRRIRSVASTQQITRAMIMVAAAKLRRNQDRLVKLRPFSDGVATILARFLPQTIGDEHPLLLSREKVSSKLMVVISGDKGLCGAFNQNILKHADRVRAECSDCPLDISKCFFRITISVTRCFNKKSSKCPICTVFSW